VLVTILSIAERVEESMPQYKTVWVWLQLESMDPFDLSLEAMGNLEVESPHYHTSCQPGQFDSSGHWLPLTDVWLKSHETRTLGFRFVVPIGTETPKYSFCDREVRP
jgi:hypothetical protein